MTLFRYLDQGRKISSIKKWHGGRDTLGKRNPGNDANHNRIFVQVALCMILLVYVLIIWSDCDYSIADNLLLAHDVNLMSLGFYSSKRNLVSYSNDVHSNGS